SLAPLRAAISVLVRPPALLLATERAQIRPPPIRRRASDRRNASTSTPRRAWRPDSKRASCLSRVRFEILGDVPALRADAMRAQAPAGRPLAGSPQSFEGRDGDAERGSGLLGAEHRVGVEIDQDGLAIRSARF